MINKLKSFAITMLVTGATVAATSAPAAANTNTFTNIIQSLTLTLTAYSNAVPNETGTKTLPEKPVTITTKTILAALSNASGLIPSLVGFNFGKSPQLVLSTTFASSNVITYTTNPVSTNTITLSNNAAIFSLNTNTNAFPALPYVTAPDTNGSATLTNNSDGTNVIAATGSWSLNGGTNATTNATTTTVSFVGTNGFTNLDASVPTNAGLWTVFTESTNASGNTNITAVTYTNVPSTSTNYVTNHVGIEVQGGTAAAPVYAQVGNYITSGVYSSVTISATGTGLGTTNRMYTSHDTDGIGSYSVGVFNTSASGSAGNLSLNLSGFAKTIGSLDVLKKVNKSYTNEVGASTSTATVAGSGSIGGTYVTNSVGVSNSVDVLSIADEYNGTNTAFTNLVTGSLTNPIPVVVTGTVVVGPPKNLGQ